MGWRIVSISSMAKLDYKMDYLVIRTQEDTRRIHLSEISVLVLESTAISLTAYLLCELSKNKIDVILCDEKRLPYGIVMPFYGSHDTSLKYRRQTAWTKEAKDTVWAEIIRAKILGQAAVLPTVKEEQKNLMLSYLPQILPGDETNREGHAAKVYFNALFGMDFSRSQDNAINAGLNYGYGILLSVFAREIVCNGYATQLGLFHDNMFNPYNLASDLMEPFRPFVDQTVFALNPQKLEHDEKVEIIQTFNRQIVLCGKKQYLLNAIKIYTKSIFSAIEEGDISLISFPNYELSIYENDRIF